MFVIENQHDDSDTYEKLFEEIQEVENKLSALVEVWEYKEIVKRKRHGNKSIYYVLFKRIQ